MKGFNGPQGFYSTSTGKGPSWREEQKEKPKMPTAHIKSGTHQQFPIQSNPSRGDRSNIDTDLAPIVSYDAKNQKILSDGKFRCADFGTWSEMKRMQIVEAPASSAPLRRGERVKIAMDAQTRQGSPPTPTGQIKIVDSEIIQFWIPQCLIFLDEASKGREMRISEYRKLCSAIFKHVVLKLSELHLEDDPHLKILRRELLRRSRSWLLYLAKQRTELPVRSWIVDSAREAHPVKNGLGKVWHSDALQKLSSSHAPQYVYLGNIARNEKRLNSHGSFQ